MKKQLFFAALALTALAGCTDDSFVGDQSPQKPLGEGAISFDMSTPAITRASGGEAATALDYKFKVYGVKKISSSYSNVFALNSYGADASYNASPYDVWYVASTNGTTTSNTSSWDYVGANGSSYGTASHQVTLAADQTIKYWDYSADQYEFVAYSATHTTGEGESQTPKITEYQKSGFTVQATAADLAGLYVADKLTISTKNNTATTPATGTNQIGNIVQFTFRAAAAKVRLGIYETIPGYVVKNVNFRPNASEFEATKDNAKLSGSFNGTSSSASGTFNITYNSTTGIAEFGTSTSASTYFDFGTFASQTTDVGIISTSPMWASGSATYQSVLPNTDHVANMILYVDFDLYNSISRETIHVTGAKAVVPQMYMKWNPNYAYTYLFKISDNTNGYTGAAGSPTGLYPVSFDAVTVASTDGAQVGTITTVSSPTITTYQDGSVSDAGITYAKRTGKPIYITINTDGTLATLTSSNPKLYTVAAGTTEADLMLTTKDKTEVTSGDDVLSVLTADVTSQGITFESGKAVKFMPKASTTYAIQYEISPAVAESYTEITGLTEDVSDVTGLYERSGSSEPYTYTLTENTTAQSGKTYYRYNPAIPAGYKYKIIEVGSGS